MIAVGNVTGFAGEPGLAEHALPFKYLGDGLVLRNHVIHALEQADIESDTEFRHALLTFVVAGGGFSGVEAVAELNDFVRHAARSFRRINLSEIRVILLHAGPLILPNCQKISAGLRRRFCSAGASKSGSTHASREPLGSQLCLKEATGFSPRP